MNTVKETSEFTQWLNGLADPIGKAAITRRVKNARKGNFGKTEPVGSGVSEMKIDVGPGYRVYFGRIGKTVYLLISGGTKKGQQADIDKAVEMFSSLKE